MGKEADAIIPCPARQRPRLQGSQLQPLQHMRAGDRNGQFGEQIIPRLPPPAPSSDPSRTNAGGLTPRGQANPGI